MKHTNWVRLTGIMLVLSLVLALCGCKKSQAQTEPILRLEATAATETTAATAATEPTVETRALPEETLATEPTVIEEETQPAIVETAPHTHEWTMTTKAPSCTADGHTVHTCSICGKSYTDSVAKAYGHSYNAWKTVVEPTQNSTGRAERTCGNCGKVESRTLDKLANNHKHSYTSKITKQPTCSAPGIKTFVCSCGDTYTDEIARLEHKFSNKPVAATCHSQGYTEHVCANCGYNYKDNYTGTTAHNFKSTVSAPTCLTNGFTEHRCRDCGHTYTDSIIKATGHKWGNWETVYGATEYEDGLRTKKCTACGATEMDRIPKLDHVHKYTDSVKQATCTSDGYTEHKCACGHSYKDNIVSKTGHSWSGWETITRPTATTAGQAKRVCNNCGKEEYKELPAEPNVHYHNYSVVEQVAATCESNGYIKKQCSCGDVLTETLNAKGHNWEHHHEDEVGHEETIVVCHCGWTAVLHGTNASDLFGTHFDSLPNDEKWDQSYYCSGRWIVDIPAKDWDVCTVCGATK